ncbi:MAG: hypothetical protein FJ098_15885, partial [Deltaproteobacteria bacterium]|nr:hypothetical protein [Deltaproteobacteria bacterium]
MGVHRWLVLSLSCSLLLAAALPARGEVPGLLHYQGYLTDVEGTPVSGTWTLSFQFYAQQTGGAAFFTESQVVEPEVGVFSVILGSQPGNTIDPEDFEGGTAWLGVVADDGVAEPVTLQPRQRVASHPYALRTGSAATCGEATNALSLGGVAASDYAMVAAMDGFLTADDLPDLLASLGIVPGGGYGDADVAAYLAVNGFGPGPYFNGSYLSLTNLPDLSQYLTDADLAGFVVTEDLLDQVAASGLFLMADGSVVATGDLDLGGNQLLDVVIENASAADAPETPAAGQLWFDTTSATLKVFDGATWTPLGSGLAADLACQGCVGAEDVSFGYAASPGKGGAALSAMDLVCSGCIEESDLGVSWALGESPGGAAVSALSAEDLDCTGCVTLGHIDAGTLDAGNLPYADPTGLGVSTVEEALSALDGKIEEGGLGGVVHEGNGTVLPYVEQWGLPSYGKARTYLHLMNPAQPKVVTYLYGEE